MASTCLSHSTECLWSRNNDNSYSYSYTYFFCCLQCTRYRVRFQCVTYPFPAFSSEILPSLM
jgi:hypothetical protein